MPSKPKPQKAKIQLWLADSMDSEAKANIDRMSQAAGVKRIAIMPDVHAASKACVGAVVATQGYLYPEIVGSDIGCGITTVALNCDADKVVQPEFAQYLIESLNIRVPANRQRVENCVLTLPEELMKFALSDPRLERLKNREGRVQFGTLGRGNHFLELQMDDDAGLWLMVHSGSRGLGQAISDWHLSKATQKSRSLVCLSDQSEVCQAYLADVAWAIEYARLNRLRMIETTEKLLEPIGATVEYQSLINSDHNHVREEMHFGESFWVHRKGAQSAREGELGLVPGSMGTESFHVSGRGCTESLMSCSHGAGRKMRRKVAVSEISTSDLTRQMEGVWFDKRKAFQLVEESPAAYKNIRAVMRAQRKLVRIERVLNPVLNYKGR